MFPMALPDWLPRRRTQHIAMYSCSPARRDREQCPDAAVIDTGARGIDQATRHSHSSDSTMVCTIFAIESSHIEQTMHRSLLVFC